MRTIVLSLIAAAPLAAATLNPDYDAALRGGVEADPLIAIEPLDGGAYESGPEAAAVRLGEFTMPDVPGGVLVQLRVSCGTPGEAVRLVMGPADQPPPDRDDASDPDGRWGPPEGPLAGERPPHRQLLRDGRLNAGAGDRVAVWAVLPPESRLSVESIGVHELPRMANPDGCGVAGGGPRGGGFGLVGLLAVAAGVAGLGVAGFVFAKPFRR